MVQKQNEPEDFDSTKLGVSRFFQVLTLYVQVVNITMAVLVAKIMKNNQIILQDNQQKIVQDNMVAIHIAPPIMVLQA